MARERHTQRRIDTGVFSVVMSRSSTSPSNAGQTERKADMLVQRQSSWSRTLARYVEPELDLTLHGQSAPLRSKSGSKQSVVVPGSDLEMAFVGSYPASWRHYDSGQTTPRLHGKPVVDVASAKLVHINTLELDVSGGNDTFRTRRRSRLDPDNVDGSPGEAPRYVGVDPFVHILAGDAPRATPDSPGERREYVSIANRILPQERMDSEVTVKPPDGLLSLTDTDASSSLVSLAGSTAMTAMNHRLSLDTVSDANHVNGRFRHDDDDDDDDSTTEQLNDEFVPRPPVVEVTVKSSDTDVTDVDAGDMNG